MRAHFFLGILLVPLGARPGCPQSEGRALEAILRAEDHRALRKGELALLEKHLAGGDTLLLRRALGAIGRLERPALLERLLPLLGHPLPAIRAEAVQASAQAAQGFRGDSTRGTRPAWRALGAALARRIGEETDPSVRGMLALSVGRLPYASLEEITRAQQWLLALRDGPGQTSPTEVARGLETLLRLTARRAPPGEEVVAWLRHVIGDERAAPAARRSGLGALLAAQAADPASLGAAMHSDDPLLRRLALTGVARLPAGSERENLLQSGLADTTAVVRYEALRVWSRLTGVAACPRLRDAARAPVSTTTLLALDLLGASCAADSLAPGVLLAALEDTAAGWHRRAHALLSLARLGHPRAAPALASSRSASRWQLRMYAARAATALRDTATLRRLASDAEANVREAALAGWHELGGHAADSLFRVALTASDYQLVLTAAGALAGSPVRSAAVHALLAALDRITAERRETSRDARIALLVRLRELGGAELVPRVQRYLRDFDPVVADTAAALLTQWTGRPQQAEPRRLLAPPFRLSEVERLRGARLRCSLVSGAVFEVELLVDEAPLTVARIARLAARGYYDGLTWHRVVPNFVIQGGSPGANEYVGDGPFMRDELGSRSHERGTLGISTRGRDTGDAQWFINLIDNPRLDYDYTVWGRVVSGMAAVDAVLEGEVIRKVELVSGTRPR